MFQRILHILLLARNYHHLTRDWMLMNGHDFHVLAGGMAAMNHFHAASIESVLHTVYRSVSYPS